MGNEVLIVRNAALTIVLVRDWTEQSVDGAEYFNDTEQNSSLDCEILTVMRTIEIPYIVILSNTSFHF